MRETGITPPALTGFMFRLGDCARGAADAVNLAQHGVFNEPQLFEVPYCPNFWLRMTLLADAVLRVVRNDAMCL